MLWYFPHWEMSLNVIFLIEFLEPWVYVFCTIIKPQVPDLSARLVLHLSLPQLELFKGFIFLFVYFRNLNPSVSFASFSCFHSCTIDSVMSYSSSSSSFALPNLRLELSCETAYSWLLLLLFDLIMLSFWLLFDLVLWKRKPGNGRKDKFTDYDLFLYLEVIGLNRFHFLK